MNSYGRSRRVSQALANTTGLPVVTYDGQTVYPVGSTASGPANVSHPFRSPWPLARRTKCEECGIYAEDHGDTWLAFKEDDVPEPEEPDQLDKAEQTELEERIKQLAQQAREKLEEQE